MLRKLKNVINKLLLRNDRGQVMFDDDVFLVSYPKSGNTWVRFLIGNYLTGNKCDFTNSHLIIPDIHYNPEAAVSLPRPRIIKSHNSASTAYKKVVYLVRDGRDVAVSYYYYLRKYNRIPADMNFRDYLPRFINGSLDEYGSWGEHVQGWVECGSEDFILIRYEDLRSNLLPSLMKIINFCGLDVNKNKAIEAIKASDFKKMQSLEKRQHKEVSLLSESDPDLMFVRKGEVGGWRNYFDNSMLVMFMESFEPTLNCHGYL